MNTERLHVERHNLMVLGHAILRARERIPACRRMTNQQITDFVRQHVLDVVNGGELHTSKTKPFRARGEPNRLPVGQRFVAHGDVGFIIDIGLYPTVSVVTVVWRREEIPR